MTCLWLPWMTLWKQLEWTNLCHAADLCNNCHCLQLLAISSNKWHLLPCDLNCAFQHLCAFMLLDNHLPCQHPVLLLQFVHSCSSYLRASWLISWRPQFHKCTFQAMHNLRATYVLLLTVAPQCLACMMRSSFCIDGRLRLQQIPHSAQIYFLKAQNYSCIGFCCWFSSNLLHEMLVSIAKRVYFVAHASISLCSCRFSHMSIDKQWLQCPILTTTHVQCQKRSKHTLTISQLACSSTPPKTSFNFFETAWSPLLLVSCNVVNQCNEPTCAMFWN